MSTRRGLPGSAQGVSVVPRACPAPNPGRFVRTAPRRVPRQAISVVLPSPPSVSWRMLGAGMGLALLFLTGLTLAALALRPRAPAPVPGPVAQAEVKPAPKPEVPVPPAPAEALEPAQRAAEPPAVLPQQEPAPVEVAREAVELPPPVAPVPAVAKIKPNPEPAPPQAICGTAVAFVPSPIRAARQADEEGKLLFTLHVSGNFEDPGFT